MIELTRGDLLTADTDALVNPVNCVGVMGRGLALAFRTAYPDNFAFYKAACDKNEVRPGAMLLFDRGTRETPRYIVNFPTKRHWKHKSRIADIEDGLMALAADVQTLGIGSLAMPPLGCGLGGLSWEKVKPLIESTFADVPAVRVLLYEPM